MNNTLDFKLILTAFLLLLLSSFVHGELQAATGDTIKCNSMYGKKIITLKNDSVTMGEWESNSRAISSVNKVKTLKRGNSLTKTLYFQGQKHKIHLENLSQLSENTDYMTISNQEGHQMTYSLNCYFI
jgi:hypothetical protein